MVLINGAALSPVAHDLKRKQALATGRITDNATRLTATLVDQFDLSRTIFKTLPPRSLPALFARTKIDMHYTFDPRLAAEIEKAYSRVPRPVADDSAILKFMHEECDFSIEHADGSFLDHLHFCHEYAARYYTTASSSPRVLLLHSIMGVGTNCFPMTLEKVPMLKSLVSEKDFAQLEAFPSILRLLIHGYLLNELAACDATKLGRLRSIRFYRLLDNGLLTLTAAQLFENLNYQMIHAIDFLPPASWKRTSGTYFFNIFVQLQSILARAGQLRARVGYDPAEQQPLVDGAIPNTWRHYLIELLPTTIVINLAAKTIAKYSAQVGHSLAYTLEWSD
ncbi:hypothetical protein Ctob_007744 [Chrysochromulina tobinii]|uniref:Uncharacterized protein n=1 Tax=Chrysochromulina tobinii TaxID=1460289 RepID=A0A0M0J575_9EUKA|nr:hypothetical protein Ctob_007744 [Chrysochromulina tobinii]|eukprot:KOO21447.1 hypothetical protein Ctob_007744 [Chrysochromulina sp. CCMP291]